MSSELTKRILITLAILFVARALSYLPIPTINLAAISTLAQTVTPDSGFGAGVLSRPTVGALGLFPYLRASILAVLALYFRRFRHGIDDRDVRVEFYTICLAGVIALLQSYGVAIFLEALPSFSDGSRLVPNPGWGFRGVTMLAMTAGTMLLIWLANVISQKGIGNGVCLIVLSTFVERVPAQLADFEQKLKSGNWMLNDVVIIFIPLAVILFLAAFALVVAHWSPPVRKSPFDNVFSSPLQLRLNGTGVGGLGWAMSLLSIPATVANFLPTGSLGKRLLESMTCRISLSKFWLRPSCFRLLPSRWIAFDNSSCIGRWALFILMRKKKVSVKNVTPALTKPMTFAPAAARFLKRIYSVIRIPSWPPSPFASFAKRSFAKTVA